MRPRSAIFVLSVMTAVSCAGHHEMKHAAPGTTPVCRECYEQALRVWDTGRYSGKRWHQVPQSRVRVEHQCASCKATMAVHTEDGQWTIHCPTCAPEGVPCDRCMPSDSINSAAQGK